jgi:hypothetical protein
MDGRGRAASGTAAESMQEQLPEPTDTPQSPRPRHWQTGYSLMVSNKGVERMLAKASLRSIRCGFGQPGLSAWRNHSPI